MFIILCGSTIVVAFIPRTRAKWNEKKTDGKRPENKRARLEEKKISPKIVGTRNTRSHNVIKKTTCALNTHTYVQYRRSWFADCGVGARRLVGTTGPRAPKTVKSDGFRPRPNGDERQSPPRSAPRRIVPRPSFRGTQSRRYRAVSALFVTAAAACFRDKFSRKVPKSKHRDRQCFEW